MAFVRDYFIDFFLSIIACFPGMIMGDPSTRCWHVWDMLKEPNYKTYVRS